MPSNVWKILLQEKMALTTEPNPDTMKYHRDEAKMIHGVAVQHMQGWQGAITIAITMNMSVTSA